MKSVRLIVNADDFGFHPDINRGIVQAFERGIVRSTSAAPCGEAFADAVRLARSHPGIGVGIHLALVEERPILPVSRIPSLVVEGGRFHPDYRSLFRNLYRVRLAEVRAEWAAQIERFLESGLVPTHLDSHQHVHAFPAFFPIIRELADRFGIRGVRSHSLPWREAAVSGAGGWGLAVFGRFGRAGFRMKSLQTPDSLLGTSCSGRLDLPRLHGMLGRLAPGVHELMCHPAVETAGLRERYGWGFGWGRELEALTDRSTLQLVRAGGIQLISYGGLRC